MAFFSSNGHFQINQSHFDLLKSTTDIDNYEIFILTVEDDYVINILHEVLILLGYAFIGTACTEYYNFNLGGLVLNVTSWYKFEFIENACNGNWTGPFNYTVVMPVTNYGLKMYPWRRPHEFRYSMILLFRMKDGQPMQAQLAWENETQNNFVFHVFKSVIHGGVELFTMKLYDWGVGVGGRKRMCFQCYW